MKTTKMLLRSAMLMTAALALAIFMVNCSKTEDDLVTPKQVTPLKIVNIDETGSSCTQIMAGQFTEVGTVCLEDDFINDLLTVTYTTTGGWEITEIHFAIGDAYSDIPMNKKGNLIPGQFQKSFSFPAGVTTHILTVPFSDFGAIDCDQDIGYFAAAHCVVRLPDGNGGYLQTETGWGNGSIIPGNSWGEIFGFKMLCYTTDDYEETSETAWAYGCDDAECFLNIADGDGGYFNRWGWTNGPLSEEGTYYFDLYAGAGQCNLTSGTLVGELIVNYDGTEVLVTFNTCGGYTMDETQLYVGTEILPRNNQNEFTVAPGQFPYKHENLNGVATDSYPAIAVTGPFYVVAHAVVLGNFFTGDDCGTPGCDFVPACDQTVVTTLFGNISNYLVELDPVTGDATQVAVYNFGSTGVQAISRLAFDATTGTLYGLASLANGYPSRPALVIIDPCTGDVTLVGEILVTGSTVHFAEGFAINPDGIGYVSASLNGHPNSSPADYYSEKLLTVNLITAAASVVGTIGGYTPPGPQTDGDGLEFVGSTLYMCDDDGDGPSVIYTLNVSTAVATNVGTLSSPRINNVGDFAWNPVTNILYSFDPGAQTTQGRYLCTISQPGTAIATLIGITHLTTEFGGARLTGITWASWCCD